MKCLPAFIQLIHRPTFHSFSNPFEHFVTQQRASRTQFLQLSQTLESQNDASPRNETIRRFQLASLLPHGHAGLLKGIVDEVPGGKHGPRVSPQNRFVLDKEPHEVSFGRCFRCVVVWIHAFLSGDRLHPAEILPPESGFFFRPMSEIPPEIGCILFRQTRQAKSEYDLIRK